MQKGSQPLRQIIYERIDRLLSLAQEALKMDDQKHARRYVFLARKLSLRYNCRMLPSQKIKMCKNCGLPLVPGLNVRIRLKKRTKSVHYICSCGKATGIKYYLSQSK
ncbi:MAG: hypothetical protein QXN37_02935 [Candidatus Anstonellaceae archaeon]